MSIDNTNTQLELSDTGMGLRKVSQIVSFGDLTDGGGADGTITLNKKIPAGSFVIGSKVTVKDGFAGDVQAVLKLGNAGDDNAYSQAGTFDIFASNQRNLVKSAIITADVGLIPNAADTSVLGVVSTNGDFTAVTAGKMLIEVFYLSTNVELKDGPVNEIRLG